MFSTLVGLRVCWCGADLGAVFARHEALVMVGVSMCWLHSSSTHLHSAADGRRWTAHFVGWLSGPVTFVFWRTITVCINSTQLQINNRAKKKRCCCAGTGHVETHTVLVQYSLQAAGVCQRPPVALTWRARQRRCLRECLSQRPLGCFHVICYAAVSAEVLAAALAFGGRICCMCAVSCMMFFKGRLSGFAVLGEYVDLAAVHVVWG